MAPKVLATVHVRDKEYFVDLRLGQFREVQNPHAFVDFDTPEGEDLLKYVPLAECQHCGFRAIISSAHTDDELHCMKCYSKVWMF